MARAAIAVAVVVAVLASAAAASAKSDGRISDMVRREAQAAWPAGKAPFGIGFSVRSGGILVTAAHVVAGCRTIEIIAAAGRPAPARILLVDRDRDVAVLRIDAGASEPGRLAERTSRAGDRLMRPDLVAPEDAMPSGLETVTVTRVAGDLGPASVLVLKGLFMPGTSGSPLLDRDGAVSAMLIGRMAAPGPAGVAIPASEIAGDLRRIKLPAEAPPPARSRESGFVRVVRCRPS